ncbi:aldo/keto reductase [Streptomyces noursei]|uniref:aldo/keto reductase n=1 Tax=Streptomyces noursei TaxID=1971 RepID=UPI0023B787EE|nr:aldo/keto reductase [Streptomyces noursei]
MRTRPFGPTGVRVPVIGQGTWQLEQADPQTAIRTLNTGIDAGMTHLDTAESYGAGAVEELVGQAVRHRRHEVFLASKVRPVRADTRGTVAACEGSLRRLGTDHLDLYLLHWPSQHPLEDTLTGLRQLHRDGKILHYGVSNFYDQHLTDLFAYTEPGEITCNQVLYHLGERSVEHHVATTCLAASSAVVGYSPFGLGNFPPSPQAATVLDRIAHSHAATRRQIALAFLTRSPHTFAIPRTATPAHALENAGAAQITLTEQDTADLATACPLPADDGHLPVT